MVAQKNKSIQIDAIDIDENNLVDAASNFKNSYFSERLTALNADFTSTKFKHQYDLIFSNPPFYEDGLKNKNVREANAKHESSLPIHLLIQKAFENLSDTGDFWIILPFTNYIKWKEFSISIGFYLNECIVIYGKPNIPKRVVFCLSKKNEVMKETILTVRDNENRYTDQYIDLTVDYHGVDVRKIEARS
jgi:tRNA1Val (adenine37-N6)-methyltransferase